MSAIIVVDTSVFISAIIGPKGPNRELLRQCFEGKYSPLMGNALFCEYEDVTKRADILSKCRLSSAEVDTLLSSFFNICEWISVYYLWRPNLSDEADNHILELAIAGNASLIATNNIRDFRHAELHFPDIEILTPQQILRGN